MRPLVSKYIKGEIKSGAHLLSLRDNAEFMLDVFRNQMKASEFNNVTAKLKDDDDFIQRTKDIFAPDRIEYYNLCMIIREWKKNRQAKPVEENTASEFKRTVTDSFRWKHTPVKETTPVAKVKVRPVVGKVLNSTSPVCPQTKPVTKEISEEQKKVTEKEENQVTSKVTDRLVVPKKPNKKTVPKVTTTAKKTARPSVNNTPKCEVKEQVETVTTPQNEALSNFENLVSKLPIDDYSRLQIIDKFSEASEEKQMVAILMIYDFLNQYNPDGPGRHPKLMKSYQNKQYNHILRF